MKRIQFLNKSTRLAFLTVFAVSGTFILAGMIIVPVLVSQVEKRYLLIQADLNARQARAFSRYAQSRLSEGSPESEIQSELQALLSGGDAELGYSCVVDRGNTEYVCHPMATVLGMSVAGKQAAFAQLGTGPKNETRVPWENAIAQGVKGAGTLLYPDLHTEIIHMEQVPGTNWTISTHENTQKVQSELSTLRDNLIAGALVIGIFLAIPAALVARVVSRRHEKQIEAEQDRSERLLLNILPQPIAERLKDGDTVIADRHREVTVLFADIVGFTPMASRQSAQELVEWLNQVFSRFDEICSKYDLEKIKTIGDAYMLCGGLEGNHKTAARNVILAGLEMIEALHEINASTVDSLQLRIGVHTGELVAGVIGKRKFSYDLWGDVVNTASRLESNGLPGRIQISEETAALVKNDFHLSDRKNISIKGKGEMNLWLVEAESSPPSDETDS